MEQPKIIGSGAALYGFLQGMLKREPLVLPPEVVQYLRVEQRGKLRRKLTGLG
jgi:hypothetical protein